MHWKCLEVLRTKHAWLPGWTPELKGKGPETRPSAPLKGKGPWNMAHATWGQVGKMAVRTDGGGGPGEPSQPRLLPRSGEPSAGPCITMAGMDTSLPLLLILHRVCRRKCGHGRRSSFPEPGAFQCFINFDFMVNNVSVISAHFLPG